MSADDDDMMAALRRAAQHVDPVPPEVNLHARSAIAYRRLDAELAELTADSLMGAGSTAMRAEDSAERLLTFAVEEYEIELEVAVEVDDRRRIAGQLIPPAEGRVTIRTGSQTTDMPTDSLGRFHSTVDAGPVSLQATWGDGRRIETSWVLL